VALIGVLVAASSPTFVRLLRDRRVNRAAMHLVDSYRTGRTRAMGHGQPILVVWDPANGLNDTTQPGSKGLIRIIEPVVKAGTARTSCQTTNWTLANTPLAFNTFVQEYGRIDFKNGLYTYTDATFTDDGAPAAPATRAEICFAPSGRTYIRTGTGAAFRPMTGVASFAVTNTDTGQSRTVFIPPNGVARMQL